MGRQRFLLSINLEGNIPKSRFVRGLKNMRYETVVDQLVLTTCKGAGVLTFLLHLPGRCLAMFTSGNCKTSTSKRRKRSNWQGTKQRSCPRLHNRRRCFLLFSHRKTRSDQLRERRSKRILQTVQTRTVSFKRGYNLNDLRVPTHRRHKPQRLNHLRRKCYRQRHLTRSCASGRATAERKLLSPTVTFSDSRRQNTSTTP